MIDAERQSVTATAALGASCRVDRRRFLGSSVWLALAGCGLVEAADAALQTPADTVGAALAAIGQPVASTHIRLTLPALIEDGAVVPVNIAADLPGVQALYVLADMNPMPIAAQFRIGPGTAARIAVRLKLAGSGRLYGAARSADGLFWTSAAANVSVGGCS